MKNGVQMQSSYSLVNLKKTQDKDMFMCKDGTLRFLAMLSWTLEGYSDLKMLAIPYQLNQELGILPSLDKYQFYGLEYSNANFSFYNGFWKYLFCWINGISYPTLRNDKRNLNQFLWKISHRVCSAHQNIYWNTWWIVSIFSFFKRQCSVHTNCQNAKTIFSY